MSDWDIEALKKFQQEAAGRVSLRNESPPLQELKTVGAADVSCGRFSKKGYGAVVVFSYPDLERMEGNGEAGMLAFPYIPGYLAFREYPLIEACLGRLKHKLDVLICDGQGIAHPRRYGLASHVGVMSGLVTIGCGKSRLVGEYEEPGNERGSHSDLMLDGEKIGEVVRTRTGVAPLFISPGHRIEFAHATQFILAVCPKFRQPEPIRAAHAWVNRMRRADGE